jgi:mannosyltransferase OCH1-like enzyme
MIPKIIWQTYELDYDDLRHDYKMASLTWKNLNPEWEYRYCSAEERKIHVKEYSNQLYYYYEYLSPINKADVWRLCVLYTYGGLYTDMDSVCQNPIDQVFKKYIKNDNFILAPRIRNGIACNGTMASLGKSDTIKKIIDDLLIRIKEEFIRNDKIVNVTFYEFAAIIKKYNEEIDFNLLSALHGSHEKDCYSYTSDFDVWWNDKYIKYGDLAKENNWIF